MMFIIYIFKYVATVLAARNCNFSKENSISISCTACIQVKMFLCLYIQDILFLV